MNNLLSQLHPVHRSRLMEKYFLDCDGLANMLEDTGRRHNEGNLDLVVERLLCNCGSLDFPELPFLPDPSTNQPQRHTPTCDFRRLEGATGYDLQSEYQRHGYPAVEPQPLRFNVDMSRVDNVARDRLMERFKLAGERECQLFLGRKGFELGIRNVAELVNVLLADYPCTEAAETAAIALPVCDCGAKPGELHFNFCATKGGPSGGVTMTQISDSELERRMGFARQEAARAWMGKTVMDTDLAEEFAKILVVHMYEPHLGCARTSELEAEVKSRGGRESPTIEHD